MPIIKTHTIRFTMCLLCSLLVSILTAQKTETDAAESIIAQVWQPFKTAYEARDSETFKALHTEDMLRITDEHLLTGAEYKASIDRWQPLPDGSSMTIDLALESSNVTGTNAYQVGYYRVLFSEKGKEPEAYYGQFHVVLKQENGVWKIAQDFDTGTVNGVAVDAVFFDKARLLKLE
ncbi:nuclear transport factor 2 family protein [Altibacter sp.]|uniref:YybH family protein n=1 Tax=Altibacter sp. TaxID=2024823 RepID=UPI000C8E4120|nr:nuclear transport factor 2 family protein [Altibacter sp.]MAP53872.1 hypothetical protein [Altibacter sp.]